MTNRRLLTATNDFLSGKINRAMWLDRLGMHGDLRTDIFDNMPYGHLVEIALRVRKALENGDT